MPLELKPPRKGKSPNWTIRGTYLGVHVDKSSGTPKRSVAGTVLKRLEEAIERGEYPPKVADSSEQSGTFLSAAVAYMEFRNPSPKFRRYIKRLIVHFRETPIGEFDQVLIDKAAATLH